MSCVEPISAAVPTTPHIENFTMHSTWNDTASSLFFSIGSLLNEPLCRAREFSYMAQIVDSRYPDYSQVEKVAQKALFIGGAAFAAATALITTLPGIVCRHLAISLQTHPFTYQAGQGEEKLFDGHRFTLFSWNICGVPAGYSITDGGVLPWRARIDAVTETILAQDADVVCLYEVFDTCLSDTLLEKLGPHYRHFYCHVGERAVGAPSGIFVASKHQMTTPFFAPFPKDMLDGRTKMAEKGVFSFSLGAARLFATHLQHSEIVGTPTETERACRRAQMEMITHAQRASLATYPILLGDLNFDPDEAEHEGYMELFTQGDVQMERPTWNGDAFCAALTDKEGSAPCTLDWVFALQERACTLETQTVETGFDGSRFQAGVSSDHDGLMTRVTLLPPQLVHERAG